MVASYPQVMQQLSQGNSEKASYSQVTVIHSHGLKHSALLPACLLLAHIERRALVRAIPDRVMGARAHGLFACCPSPLLLRACVELTGGQTDWRRRPHRLESSAERKVAGGPACGMSIFASCAG